MAHGQGERGGGLGEKESRVSRVTIRFGSAEAACRPAGSWGLCPFVIPCMEYTTYMQHVAVCCVGHGECSTHHFELHGGGWMEKGARTSKAREQESEGVREKETRRSYRNVDVSLTGNKVPLHGRVVGHSSALWLLARGRQ